MKNSIKMNQIIDGGYCIGCGVCNSVDSDIRIELNAYGMYQAKVTDASDEGLKAVLKVCPFSNDEFNEDQIGRSLFGSNCDHDSRIGFYHSLFIGHVLEGDFRKKATSGGIISWICSELLKQDLVDKVIHVKKTDRKKDGMLFRYGVSQNCSEVMEGAKSRYYPVEMSEVLQTIRDIPGRYVVVGLPCFIKAVRKLMGIDPMVRERVKYCVGLVCGHLKSTAFADCFAWQSGIKLGDLTEIDFRVKQLDKSAGDYSVYLRSGSMELVRPTREFLGANWGHNFFRYEACNYCDDVFAETADITVGDAWLPLYEKDPMGTSVIVTRNKKLSDLIEIAGKQGRLRIIRSSADEISASQGGGLRDRREGLAYRLLMKQKKCEWVPEKRVVPLRKGVPYLRQLIYKSRQKLQKYSHIYWHEAVQRHDFRYFERRMKKLIKSNERYYRSLVVKVARCIKRVFLYVLNEKQH